MIKNATHTFKKNQSTLEKSKYEDPTKTRNK